MTFWIGTLVQNDWGERKNSGREEKQDKVRQVGHRSGEGWGGKKGGGGCGG